MNFNVVVSHPHRQASVYQWPLALREQGVSVRFLTGLYFRPEAFPYCLAGYLPAARRANVLEKLQKRNIAALGSDNVVSLTGPWPEIVFRPLGLLGCWYQVHDIAAASWFRRNGSGVPTILHCFDGSCTRTIRAARRRGVITFLEITLPACASEVIAEEYAIMGTRPPGRSPGAEPSMRSLRSQMDESDYVVAQSTYTVNYLLRYGVPPGKIVLQPLGVDVERFCPDPAPNAKDCFRVLFSGQISIRKGLYYLLEAWRRLNLTNAELVLTGWPVDRHGVELLEKYKGIYRWLGFVKDEELPGVYRSSSICVLPSLAEGGSNVVNEALASGLPCVVSTNAGSSVRDGVEGYVVPIRDVETLMERIVTLYRDPRLVEQMGIAARQRAERLTWREFGRRLVLMYREKLGEAGSAGEVLDMSDR